MPWIGPDLMECNMFNSLTFKYMGKNMNVLFAITRNSVTSSLCVCVGMAVCVSGVSEWTGEESER